MKILYLIILLITIPLVCRSATLQVAFSDGAALSVSSVEIIEASLATWSNSNDQLKSMFYSYNMPSSINAYKSVFYKSEYPWQIEDIYDTWQSKMDGVTFDVHAIFKGVLDDREIACIQYSFRHSSTNVNMSLLVKRMEGKWYPFAGNEMTAYQHVMGLMAVIQPALVVAVVEQTTNAEVQSIATTLRSQCGSTIREDCLYAVAEQWGTSQERLDQIKEKQLFKSRFIVADMPASKQAAIDSATTAYINGLSVTPEGKRIAAYYLRKEEKMKALAVLYAHGLETDKQTLMNDLNTMQQSTALRIQEYQVAEKPNSN